jgi:hypothetical protein
MKWSSKNIVLFTGAVIAIIAVMAIVFYGTGHSSVKNISEFNAWLNKEKHGCIKEREINGVRVTVKYQPPNYQVLKELESNSDSYRALGRKSGSLKMKQQRLITFLMSISPAESMEKKKGVMYEGVEGYGDYVQRVMATNFYMDHYLKLYIDGVSYEPVLSTVENVYELSQARNFVVVFAVDSVNKLKKGDDFLFVYDDPFFNMGKLQFDFSGDRLRNAGAIKIVGLDDLSNRIL